MTEHNEQQTVEGTIAVEEAATVEAREAKPAAGAYWELAGDPARAEIIYVDPTGKTRFPDTPLYKYPGADQERHVRAGRRVYDGDEVQATDAALRKAEELDVDLGAVEGTGQDGQIKINDVERDEGIEEHGGVPPVETEEDEAAFWQLFDGSVLYYDGEGRFSRPDGGGYAAPHDDVLERLDKGERVYVDEG